MGDPRPPNVEVVDWDKRTQQALETALEVGALEAIKDQQDIFIKRFLAGEVSGAEFDRQEKEVDVCFGAVICEQLADFRACLTAYGLSREEVEELASHEGAHFETARQKGLKPYFQVQFAKGNGSTKEQFVYPSINFKFPSTMSDDVRRKILREVIEAAEDPSPRDLAQLGREL